MFMLFSHFRDFSKLVFFIVCSNRQISHSRSILVSSILATSAIKSFSRTKPCLATKDMFTERKEITHARSVEKCSATIFRINNKSEYYWS